MGKKNFTKRGISLIVLVITIIVVIILAAAVILSLGENNPINDSKIASLVQSKDTMESSVQLFLTKGISQTQGMFNNLQLVTGIEGMPTSEEPILKQGAADYKIVYGKSSTPANGTTPSSVTKKTRATLENGEEKWLYQIDPSAYESKVTKGIKSITSDSTWYIEPENSKIYLIFNNKASYPQWMIGKDKRVDVNLVDSIGRLTTENATNDSEKNSAIAGPNLDADTNGEGGGSSVADNEGKGANAPEMLQGMIPVYYDEGSSTWKKADASNKDSQWFEYSTTNKKWANVVTVESSKRSTYQSAAVGTTIEMADINTMWVWVPRYAYSIQGGAYKKVTTNTQNKLEIRFLTGNSKKDLAGNVYGTDYDENNINPGDDTPFIVHPAFTLGAQELKGIWVAKFEASASPNSNGRYPGEYYKSTTMNAYNDYPYVAEGTSANTYLKIVPGASSWRGINIGNMYNQCVALQSSKASVYGWSSSNAHLMKNDEWGAVAYLSASKYGKLPNINSEGQYVTWNSGKDSKGNYTKSGGYINIKAGTSNYASATGRGTTTTGNIYGIYDMSGGSWEYVAAYMENNNGNLKGQGNSLISAASKYKNTYQSSAEEKNNAIADTVAGSGTITQNDLWNTKISEVSGKEAYNTIRSRLTKQNYELMKGKKGDAMYETIQDGTYSYYGRIVGTDSTGAKTYGYNWMTNPATNSSATTGNWDSDYTLLGHSSLPFFLRGGYYNSGSGAGVFAVYAYNGYASSDIGFRPVVSSAQL